MLTLLQASKPVDLRNVIHDYFNRATTDPGTWKEIILGVAAVLIFLVVLHIVFYAEKRSSSPRRLNDPRKLYCEILHRLPLSRAQKSVMTEMALHLGNHSPTHMLLSPRLFAEACRQWASTPSGPHAGQDEQLQAIAQVLFPEAPGPTTTPDRQAD